MLLELTENQLNKVSELAGLFMTIEEIATIIEVDVDILHYHIMDRTSEVSKRYYKAKISAIYEQRKKEKELATAGSPLAIQSMENAIKKMNDYED